ncbi:fluoride efflux transporter FluC [Limosilactobacillus mucosae]|uniref:fluoride efflux transporter FluC n=1 Tax=Limosilactobacillus mucosae TaxID=97478 RepID=UPI000886C36E|nr:CrcB family protein [Limosilactobacillus mucosae]SDN05414.1 camphor resistance protein CrcB [Limosilactobacillus mucosae]SEK38807.1 camphor resistance protein CrcB [Limosilactobacillus mucosae]SFJ94181.1 camphor resistance protein CrcB [Limosilactobacillus mucosae]
MTEILLIGLGASLGAALRWILTLTWKKWGRSGWPIATLFINLTGSFLIGWLSNIAMTDSLRLFLTTGLLGGYTTFSTFNTELLAMLDEGKIARWWRYMLISVLGGLGFAWLGMCV